MRLDEDGNGSMTQADATSESNERQGWRAMGRALGHRNYRLFFLGQGVSLVGTWMQRVALSWLVYRLTGSEALLGVVGFSSQILTFVAAPFAGVLADRANCRRLIVITQVMAMVQAFVLAALTLTGTIRVWEIVALSATLGLINGFDIPLRQAFIVEMLERREDLPNALALNSFLVNAGKLVGPAMAGAMIAVVGEGVCFMINGWTFVAVIAALVAMRVRPKVHAAAHEGVLKTLMEGFSYSWGFEPIRAILLLLAWVSLTGLSLNVLFPVFAADVLHGGPKTLGFLTAAMGLGAIGGGLFLAAQRRVVGLGAVMMSACVLMGVCLVAFGASTNLYASLALLVATGFATMVHLVGTNTLLQTLVDEDKRGRVMSLYTMCFMGMGPFGNLLAGVAAERWGASNACVIGGVACIVGGAIFACRLPALGRIAHGVYVRKGHVVGEDVDGVMRL